MATGCGWHATARTPYVLIHSAAGGVGSFAVQFACWRRARVSATATARNTEFVRVAGQISGGWGSSVSSMSGIHGVTARAATPTNWGLNAYSLWTDFNDHQRSCGDQERIRPLARAALRA